MEYDQGSDCNIQQTESTQGSMLSELLLCHACLV